MNELLHQLKKLTSIESDADYARRSRQLILQSVREPKKKFSIAALLGSSLQFGVTVALTGILLLVVLGGLGIGEFLSPFHLASLDPTNLRAEAQAIDIQIQLTDLNYHESLNSQSTPSTAAPTISSSITPASKDDVQKKAAELGISSVSPSSSESIGIDEALNRLAE